MDRGWSQMIVEQENANVAACEQTAVRNGHTPDQAENCDAGSVGCPDCPFKREEVNHG